MEDELKVQCYSNLLQTQMDHFKQTREIEFKVNIAIWTLLALAGSFLYDKIIPGPLFWSGYAFISLALVAIHWGWMYLISLSQDDDKKLMDGWMSALPLADDGIDESQTDKKDTQRKMATSRFGYWIIVEVGFTILILAGLGLLFAHLHTPPKLADIPQDQEILDADGAALALGVPRRYVLQMAHEGQIPGRKLGQVWRFIRTDLRRWISGTAELDDGGL